jgi:hypothetical protein
MERNKTTQEETKHGWVPSIRKRVIAMRRIKSSKLIAAGPLFQVDGDPTTRRRALLIRRLSVTGKAEYLLGIQSFPEGDIRTRRLKTRRRNHAVRFFCDYMLDQAVQDDWAVEAMYSADQAGLE